MAAWKEQHYARAEQFVRLLVNALGESPATKAGPTQPPAISAASTQPPSAKPDTPAPPPAAARPPGPTAASVFKSIPWKK